ncbi:MAG: ImmA/IrrE family metallo-endopeptidase [Bacilli bacterium]
MQRYFGPGDPLKYNFNLCLPDILNDFALKIEEIHIRSSNLSGFIDMERKVVVINRNHNKSRRLFTKAHELGHFFLHRDKGVFADGKIHPVTANHNSKDPIEQQANVFASMVILPDVALSAMLKMRYSFRRIAEITGMSSGALKWRLVAFIRQFFGEHNKLAIDLVENFKNPSNDGDSNAPYIFRVSEFDTTMIRTILQYTSGLIDYVCTEDEFSRFVTRCSNTLYEQVLSAQHISYEVKSMGQFDKVETNEAGRFLKCPNCGNPHLSQGARYCKMCRFYLYNYCTNEAPGWHETCGKINDGDARFCETCGAETYLMVQEILIPWKRDESKFSCETDSFPDEEGSF